jgi:ribosomal protein S27AE
MKDEVNEDSCPECGESVPILSIVFEGECPNCGAIITELCYSTQ